MISELFVMSSTGECILSKKYQSDVVDNSYEVFRCKLQKADASELEPYCVGSGLLFVHILRHGLFFVATAPDSCCPLQILDLLNRFYRLVKDFCGVVSEATVRSNLILIMELLNEYLDCGSVQLSATGKLKPYIYSDPVAVRQVESRVPSLFGIEARVAPYTAADRPVVSSRPEQEQRTNEVFVDVVERLTVSLAADGHVLHSELHGEIKMKSFLVGTPVIRLSLNEDLDISERPDKLTGYGNVAKLSNCKFHECVTMDNSRTLSIRPPEGEVVTAVTSADIEKPLTNHNFLSYSVDGNFPVNIPFRVLSRITTSSVSQYRFLYRGLIIRFSEWIVINSDTELSLRLNSEIPINSHAINVVIQIPLPSPTTSITQQLSGASRGHKAKLLHGRQKMLEWSLPDMSSNVEESAHFKLIGAQGDGSHMQQIGPLSMDFELSDCVCSNMQIRSVQLVDCERSLVPQKWLRYITTADSYQIKLV